MNDRAREAALTAVCRQMRTEHDLARHVAAGSLLALRGSLREIDDRLCGMDQEQLERLAHAEPGLASVN